MIRKILMLSIFVTGLALTSCGGSKKPQEKVDHSKVDKAYNDFNNKNK
jgi:hypothetical protein